MSSVVVTGTARQLVQPDRVSVGLGLSADAADAATALDQVSARSITLRDRLADLGFEPGDWVTDGVGVAEEWEYRRDTHTLVGHRATTAVTVTIDRPDRMDRLAPLLRVAVGDAGAQVRELRWQVDDANPVRHELLGRAALDARRRAEAYTAALGLALGAVELISETPIVVAPDPVGDRPMLAMAARGAAAPEMAIGGGQVELAAEVHVRFAILRAGS
ncbi:MAG: SIMPL domain-containing protein [Actinomycetes bacterium]|jgi:uncharacterized protein YggE